MRMIHPSISLSLSGWLVAGALAAALTLGVPTTADAQDSTTRPKDTTQLTAAADSSSDSTKWGYEVDRSGELNPAGYRGMERPVNVFPTDSAKGDSGAGADATSRVSQRKRQDTLPNQKQQNPPGYRGMERPAVDSAEQSSGTSSLKQEHHQ